MPRFAAALALVLFVAPGAWAATPTDALQQVFARADLILTDPGTEDQPLERLLAIRKLVNEAFDFQSAAELASGDHWRARTAAEQEEFTWLFADLLERAFVARMAAKAKLAGGTRITYLDEWVDGDTAYVSTAMGRKSGGELFFGYRLIERDGAWKIRDVTIDGVSVMANYRAQLDRVLGTSSFPDLLTQMRAMVGTAEPPPPTASIAEVTTAADGASVAAAPPLEATTTPPAEAELSADAPPLAPAVAVADASPTPAAGAAVDVLPVVLTAAADVSQGVPLVDDAEVSPEAETALTEELSRSALPVSVEPPPEPEPRVAAVNPVRTASLVEPPLARREPPVETAPPPRRLTTKAYWLKISTVEMSEAGHLVSRLRDGKHPVALERTSVSGKQMVQVSVGPFQDAGEAISQLLALQTKGHDPFLIAERE